MVFLLIPFVMFIIGVPILYVFTIILLRDIATDAVSISFIAVVGLLLSRVMLLLLILQAGSILPSVGVVLFSMIMAEILSPVMDKLQFCILGVACSTLNIVPFPLSVKLLYSIVGMIVVPFICITFELLLLFSWKIIEFSMFNKPDDSIDVSLLSVFIILISFNVIFIFEVKVELYKV